MNKQDILDALKSNNNDLDKVVEQYLVSFLDDPILGNNINNIEYHLEFGLNEYRINNFQQNGYDYERKTLKELRKEFNISATTYANFKRNLNGVLASYTDKSLSDCDKRTMLGKQIKSFCYDSTDDQLEAMYDKLIKDEENVRNTYLDSVIKAIDEVGINQVLNNQYMVVEKTFKIYNSALGHISYFREKKKYLKKLKAKNRNDEICDALDKYFKRIYDDAFSDYSTDYDKNEYSTMDEYFKYIQQLEEDALETMRWFYFYLAHGKAKLNAYIMDTVLGYKNKPTQKFIHNLFLIDHTSGQSKDDFSFTIREHITKDSTVNYPEDPIYNPLYQEILKNL